MSEAPEDAGSPKDVLYAVELVHDRGAYTLIVRDLVRGTLKTTPVPRKMVAKIPTYLSKLDLQEH